MKKKVKFCHFSTRNGSTLPALGKPEYHLSRLCYTSVAYVNVESRVRITALSGLTHVRISGRALYLTFVPLWSKPLDFSWHYNKRWRIEKLGLGHGENDFVASTKRFVKIASANQNCCGYKVTCYGNNCDCRGNNADSCNNSNCCCNNSNCGCNNSNCHHNNLVCWGCINKTSCWGNTVIFSVVNRLGCVSGASSRCGFS